MRRILLLAGIAATVTAGLPASEVQGYAYGFMPVSGNKLVVTFNDGAKCAMQVSVARASGTAKSASKYNCWHPQGDELKLKKVKMVNTAGIYLSAREGKRQFKTCADRQCAAPDATLAGVADNERPTGNAVFHIYYRRNVSFLFAPPNCEYARDPEGVGPPGHRLTCAIQAR